MKKQHEVKFVPFQPSSSKVLHIVNSEKSNFYLKQLGYDRNTLDFGEVDVDSGKKTISFTIVSTSNSSIKIEIAHPEFITSSVSEITFDKPEKQKLQVTINQKHKKVNETTNTEIMIISDSKILKIPVKAVFRKSPFQLDASSDFFIPLQWKNAWNNGAYITFTCPEPPVPWEYERLPKKSTKLKKNEKLTMENYEDFFIHHVNVEREQYSIDMQMYNLYNHRIIQVKLKSYFAINVPGLSEDKPKLTYGDSVILRTEDHRFEYIGWVIGKKAIDDVLYVKFPEQLDTHKFTTKFNIRFPFSKHFMFDMLVNGIQEFKSKSELFPVSIIEKKLNPVELRFYDSDLNEEQMKACRDVLSHSCPGAPYSIFGPPGTGKTRCLIEMIKLTWKYNDNVRILITTPSDTASDVITLRLSEFQKKNNIRMLRLNSYQRDPNQVPPETLPYCVQLEDSGLFTLPSKKEILEFDFIISTTFTSPLLDKLGIKNGYFDYIFVDEAAQAFEPEVLMSSKFGSKRTQIILAGDYNQLNPITRSPGNPLKLSLQERLSHYKLYKKSSNYHTMLTKNYRSHQDIFKISSQLFYSNKLEKYAKSSIVNSMCSWEELKNKKFPLLFYGVSGKEVREGESPSWKNPDEANAVVTLTTSILSSMEVEVKQTDIAIITPYRKQVQLIRNKLRNLNLSNVRVGTIEDYQGQESLITIISTVRCEPKRLSIDKNHSIGIVNHPKRFNVALTRAMALSIVVGDPNLLKLDQNWVKFIGFVKRNGNYVGCECPKEIELEAINGPTEEIVKKNVEYVLYETDNDEPEEEFCNFLDDTNWKF